MIFIFNRTPEKQGAFTQTMSTYQSFKKSEIYKDDLNKKTNDKD